MNGKIWIHHILHLQEFPIKFTFTVIFRQNLNKFWLINSYISSTRALRVRTHITLTGFLFTEDDVAVCIQGHVYLNGKRRLIFIVNRTGQKKLRFPLSRRTEGEGEGRGGRERGKGKERRKREDERRNRLES
jgi:hypothetical protein